MCFSFNFIAQILIWAIVIGAAFAILNLIVPFVLSKIGVSIASEAVALFMQIIKIIIWCIVLVFIVIVVFDIISCLLSMGGGMPHLIR